MFTRGTMDNEPKIGLRIVPVDIEWKVDAIVETDSKAFAAELQRVLNENTAQGYIVSSFMPRQDHQMVLIQQRRLIQEPEMGTAVESQQGKEPN